MTENLSDHHKDKKEYLLSLTDSIDIPIVCIRCKKYGHHVTKCRKKEKDKERKEKTPVSLQDLMIEAKMIKQEIKEIKEDNSIDINEQNIVEIINLKEFPKSMTEPPSLEKDNDSNRQNILSLPNTETINREFLTEVNSMNERLIPFKSKTEFEELT